MTKKVGYKCPPEHAQWRKGQSGNPSGRKKGQRNLSSDLLEEANEVIQIIEGGKPRKLTKQRALLKALMARAIKGDVRAASIMLAQLRALLDTETPEIATDLAAEDRALLDAYAAKTQNKRGGQS